MSIIRSGPGQSYARSIRKYIKTTDDPAKAEIIDQILDPEFIKAQNRQEKVQNTISLASRCRAHVGGPQDRIEKIIRWLRKELRDPSTMEMFLNGFITSKNPETLVNNFRGKPEPYLSEEEAKRERNKETKRQY